MVLTGLMISPRQAPASEADLEQARALFSRAVELGRHDDWDGACREYRQSLKLERSALTLYSLGAAQREAGRPEQALRTLRAFLAEPASTPNVERFRRAAERAVIELTAQVARVAVSVAPAHASVFLDGTPCGPSPEPCITAAGRHRVRVEARGYTGDSRELTVDAGETAQLDLRLEPEQAPAGAIALAISGGVATAVGAALSVVGYVSAARTDSPEPGTVALSISGNAMMAGGIAATAVGVTLWTGASGPPASDEATRPPLTLSLVTGPAGAWATLGGSF